MPQSSKVASHNLRLMSSSKRVQGGILHYAKQIASASIDGAQVLDCVIVVPPFFGPAQRQALYDAAHLAGECLAPLRVILQDPSLSK